MKTDFYYLLRGTKLSTGQDRELSSGEKRNLFQKKIEILTKFYIK